MPIYDKPVRVLMREMVTDLSLQAGLVLTKDQVIGWFEKRYPKIKVGTISAHLIRLSTNAQTRRHYNAKPSDDLFFQIDGSHFRLYQADIDPPPFYDEGSASVIDSIIPEPPEAEAPSEFAYEADLRNFLAKNLSILEPGMRLYEEEGTNGVEFPAGNRFIDILAIDGAGKYVVIELKVPRGYDRVVGQVRRYMGWIAENQAEPGQEVRGIIVARGITNDLRLACLGLADVELFEYQLAVSVRAVARSKAALQ